MLALYVWLLLMVPYAWGNTEKTIFLGPSPVQLDSKTYPPFDHLRLVSLGPDNFTLRTHLKAEFPSNGTRKGTPSWFMLRNLTEGQRYEVRVCWAATQPTAFNLEAYELETVINVPELISELSEYASKPLPNINSHVSISSQILEPGVEESVQLLRIITAADFYTTNHTLMRNVPPVSVDIILDPFILNILPQSLLSTAIYTTAVALFSWFVGKWISSCVRQIAAEPTKQKFQ
ncbi:hypothetical protein F5B22DRAFT_441905 [Xylaria bambusicola]|uniref:uncharacterized protein n=1 Tax=Xylaria bambusicola TaxID=326684 RepID=UPI002008D37A|nr:uncharacterized protein F5B22DRAFT_441905 [Xylaria bambusicola]KAI0506579.1 hypothetical protein F5B22DRAFT_441905 [Xylaria bambusicola]